MTVRAWYFCREADGDEEYSKERVECPEGWRVARTGIGHFSADQRNSWVAVRAITAVGVRINPDPGVDLVKYLFLISGGRLL